MKQRIIYQPQLLGQKVFFLSAISKTGTHFLLLFSRSCGSFQMKQLTIFHQSEGLASSSNSVELAIETKGTTDAGTAAVQRHSDRCEPLNPNRNMELKHLPCRFPNNFTISICVRSLAQQNSNLKQHCSPTITLEKRKVHERKLRLLRLSQRSCQRLQRQQRS